MRAGTLERSSRSSGRGTFDGLPSDEGGHGGDSGWAVLARARDDIDAHLLAGRLLNAGVDSRAVTDRTAPGAWLHGGSNPWAPVTIMVRKFQLEDARLVLAEISLDAPSAGSASSESSIRWNRSAWWLAAVLLGGLFTAVAVADAARPASCRTVCSQPHPSQR